MELIKRNDLSKQRTLGVKFLRKSERKYLRNLDEKNLRGNKKFRIVVKPLLSDKVVSNEK